MVDRFKLDFVATLRQQGNENAKRVCTMTV